MSAIALARPFPRLLVLPSALPVRRWLPSLQLAGKVLLSACGLTAGLLFLFLAILPRTGIYATFTVLTASMEPQIPSGSVVVVVPTPADEIRLGDVISFTSTQPPYPTLSHRVTGFSEGEDGKRIFRTKGDANLLEDPWEVRYPGQAGKVRLTLPRVGYLMAASTSVPGRTGIGLLVFFGLGWFWLRRLWATHGLPVIPAPAVAPIRRTTTRRKPAELSGIRVAMFCWLLLLLLRRRI